MKKDFSRLTKYIYLIPLLIILVVLSKLPYFNLLLFPQVIALIIIVSFAVLVIVDFINLIVKNIFVFKYGKYLFISVIFILFLFASRLPYVNIFIYSWQIFLLTWILIVWVFKLKYSINYYLSGIFLILSLISLLAGRSSLAEEFGNLIYVTIFIGFSQELYSYFSSLKYKNKI